MEIKNGCRLAVRREINFGGNGPAGAAEFLNGGGHVQLKFLKRHGRKKIRKQNSPKDQARGGWEKHR